jgi:hypothetical protein
MDVAFNASRACRELYYELTVYTLSLQEKEFIHQIAVDSYAAQHFGSGMKPITINFALVGLYLVFEKGYTGRQAQLAHIELGKKRREWPRFNAPAEKAPLTMLEVLQSGEPHFKEMIQKWGKAVWDTWKPEHQKVAALVKTYLNI